MDYKDFNRVANWKLHVFEQKKTDNAVVMNCSLAGRKKQDGTFDKSMNVRVVINADTVWPRVDFSGKNIIVNGGFQHKWWEKDGKSGVEFTVFATEVREFVKEPAPAQESADWT